MKKPMFPRIIGLATVYAGIFIVLAIIQFSNRRSFSLHVGDFVISGNYGSRGADAVPQGNERLLEGEASILYGGMEFFLTDDDGGDSLSLLTSSGGREPVRPVAMAISDSAALFRLSGGAEISFANRHNGGTQDLWIHIDLPEDRQALELPYRLLRSSRIRRNADGESHVIAGGKSYRLNASTVDFERRLIIIEAHEPTASYGMVPESEVLDPSRLVLDAARDKRRYEEALNNWRDQAFALWNLSAGSNFDEETALSYLAESALRGSYQSAAAALSPEFVGGTERSFMSSVYLGHMDQGLRSSIVYERDNFNRLSRLIADGSAEFLADPHVIEFLAVRGHGSLIDSGAEIVKSINSAVLDLNLMPGILEGYMDWLSYRPDTDNPFEPLADQACFSLSERVVAGYQGERVLVFDGGRADLEFNSRLGAALTDYGEHIDQEVWAGLGRSLILSALSFVDETGNAPRSLLLAADSEAEADVVLSSARIYRLLRIGRYSARAAGLHAAANGVWTWTAASDVTANFDQENNMLDISAAFPRGETHYMFIRGIRPFTQIRLYNIPFRTDPRFESYDSSGWAYSPSEQTLMVKMKHQLPTEHIQIYY
ncbi:MAG: hypothetical protein LBU16_05050 [Treponema sp.]|jgi:hypothetical protein|nr:hypothetical protein [Treponema sp.]